MNCKKCNFISPVTRLELVKGAPMDFVGHNNRHGRIYKKYSCPNCRNTVEVLR